jgi:hypothetical protein
MIKSQVKEKTPRAERTVVRKQEICTIMCHLVIFSSIMDLIYNGGLKRLSLSDIIIILVCLGYLQQ